MRCKVVEMHLFLDITVQNLFSRITFYQLTHASVYFQVIKILLQLISYEKTIFDKNKEDSL